MTTRSSSNTYRLIKQASDKLIAWTIRIFAVLIIVFSLAILTCWIIGQPFLLSFGEHYIPMADETAFSFLLLGVSCLLIEGFSRKKLNEYLNYVFASLILIIALIVIFDFFTDNAFGLSNFLGVRHFTYEGIIVGKMSPMTALCFLLAGISLLFQHIRIRFVSSVFATLLFVFSYTLIMGYWFKVPFLYGSNIIPVALPTTILFLLTSISLLLLRGPNKYPLKYFVGSSTQSRLMRNFMPVVFIINLFNDWIIFFNITGYDRSIAITESFIDNLSMFLSAIIIIIIAKRIGGSIDFNHQQRVLSEEAAKKSEENLAIILNSIGDGVIVTDLNGRITRMNPVALDLCGWNLEDALGKPLQEVFYIINSESREVVESPVKKVLDTGLIIGLANHTVLVSKDGNEYQIADSAAPIKNQSGELLGVVLTFSNFTEKYYLQNELIHSRDALLAKAKELSKTISELNSSRLAAMNMMEDAVEAKEALENANSRLLEEIRDRKLAEQRQILFATILEHLNRHNEWQFLIRDILKAIKAFIRFDAIGIRLRDGDDYPYYETDGFTNDFLILENSLCIKEDGTGKIKMEKGFPLLQGACGAVIHKKIDFSKPFFTSGGSFWSNNAENISDEFPYDDPETPNSLNCIKFGYRSLALIPIHSGGEIVGLLQLNDSKPDRLSLELVEFFEDIGSAIGVAFNRMQYEQKLKDSEENYRDIYDNALEGMFRTSLEGKSLKVNKALATILGFDSEKEVIAYLDDVANQLWLNPEDRKKYLEVLLKDGITRNIETKFKRRDGKIIWVSLSSRLVRDKSGNILYTEGFLEDITNRKQMELELIETRDRAEEMNKLKTNFLANMSHELRTPMVGILGFSKLMNEIDDVDEAKEMSNLINESGNRLMETLNLILNLSRIEAGELKLDLQEFDLVEFINELTYVFSSLALKKHLDFKYETRLEKMIFIADKRVVADIINNLVNNAVKFTNNGFVKITLDCVVKNEKDFVLIEVADSGIGINENDQKIIFEEFRQASEGIGRSFEGTGLGLSICKKLLDVMGGEIELKSTPGVGSVFSVFLPNNNKTDYQISQSQPSDNTVVTNNEQKPEPLPLFRKPEVLLVEDDFMNIKLIEKFTPSDYNVSFAVDAEEGWEKVSSLQFDLILMDINLGRGENGIQLTQRIRTLDNYSDVPIIALTAFAMKGDREEFLEAGCDDYLSKPFDRDDYLMILKKHTHH